MSLKKIVSRLTGQQEEGSPSIPRYTDSNIGEINAEYLDWVDAMQKWRMVRQAGLVDDEAALVNMMREVADAKAAQAVDPTKTGTQVRLEHERMLEHLQEMARERFPNVPKPDISRMIREYFPYQAYASKMAGRLVADWSAPGNIVPMAEDEQMEALPSPPGIEFVRCAYCGQMTPAYHDCSFCGAPTPVPPSHYPHYLPTTTVRWRI